MQKSLSGIVYGLLSSAAFGLIPFFTLPIVASGIRVETALTYRFGIATLVMGLILLRRRATLAIGWLPFIKICCLGFAYMLAVLLYFHALAFLPSGVVGTLQFQYPVMVMLIMIIFFHERFAWQNALAIGLAVAGVAFLSLGQEGMSADSGANIVIGTVLSLLSGFFNGLYFVGIQVARLPKIDELVFTFYVMLFGSIFCFCNSLIMGALEWIPWGTALLNAMLLALVTAVFSNLMLVLAIRKSGSTVTSIMGVMEPLTAVAVGCLVFQEPFTPALALGIALITGAVMLTLLTPGRKPGA